MFLKCFNQRSRGDLRPLEWTFQRIRAVQLVPRFSLIFLKKKTPAQLKEKKYRKNLVHS